MRRYNNPAGYMAVLVATVSAWVLLAGGGETRTATTAATTTSQSQPATYPSDRLIGASDAAAKAMLARLDKTFRAAVHPPLRGYRQHAGKESP